MFEVKGVTDWCFCNTAVTNSCIQLPSVVTNYADAWCLHLDNTHEKNYM